MRGALGVAVAVTVLLVGAAPAAPPESPVAFISVDELKALLDRGIRADIIDVRRWDAYVEVHIKGARSMPLRAVPDRAYEISKTGLVVFY
ncbi:MAG: rhodanese-like domain-containing protein [Candidatus Rokubacteria bacterium]|nr:rhodanese-like domain-containing protein [Candidatus Rokubacteria bacterium]